MKTRSSRRDFLAASTLAATALATTRAHGRPADERCPLQPGLASYTTRKLTLEQTIEIARVTGLTHLCLKDFHLPLDSPRDKALQIVERARAAGVTIYAIGVVYMKTPEVVDQAFALAGAAGLRLIVGVPTPQLLDRVETRIRETGIAVAIHNHGPEDKMYPTPASVLEKIGERDPRLGLCIDVGHTARCGIDLPTALRECGARLLDLHIADNIDAQPKTKRCVLGRGVIDLPAILQTLQEMRYRGVVALEETTANDLDPLSDLAESKGYLCGVAAGLAHRKP